MKNKKKKKKINVGDTVVPINNTSNGYGIDTIEAAEIIDIHRWRSMTIKITKGYATNGWGQSKQKTIDVAKQSFKVLEKVSSSLYPIF